MPPRNKFAKEEIVQSALEIVRESDMDAVTARAVADRLHASSKVIFGLFPDMAALKSAVLAAADEIYQKRIAEAMTSGQYPPYKASGMAYIRFAREERSLFRLLFMRDRTGESLQDTESIEPIIEIICRTTGMSREEALHFHLEMWVYVHGIATMIATGYLNWDMEQVSGMMTDAYTSLCLRFCPHAAPK